MIENIFITFELMEHSALLNDLFYQLYRMV
jgi:hypothetical protein